MERAAAPRELVDDGLQERDAAADKGRIGVRVVRRKLVKQRLNNPGNARWVSAKEENTFCSKSTHFVVREHIR